MARFPLPPPRTKMAVADVPDVHVAGATNTLLNVPAFYWSYGCSATSAAMLFGYYDRIGYANMYTGPTNGGVSPLDNSIWGRTTYPHVVSGECPLSASHNGIDDRSTNGHVDDYWVDYLSTGDPYAGHWAEHTIGTCTADYMGTNQWKYGSPVVYNQDGGTIFFFIPNGDPTYDYAAEEPTYRDGGHGMRLFAESRGYTVVTNFNQLIQGQGTDPAKGFTFANFQSEIDAGHPVLVQLEGHTMLGYGYNSTGNVVYVHDTWDYSSHTMTWGGTYNGMQHYGVTVMRLQVIPPSVTNSTGATNITVTGARLSGEVTTTGGASPTFHIYWGPTDGGTTPGGWANDVNLGVKPAGALYADISGLAVNTTYYYRSYAVNSGGGAWATATTSFLTHSLPTMEPIVEPEHRYYSVAPVLTNFGFDDAQALDSGWYQMDSYSPGAWTPITGFANVSGTSWDGDNWTIPGFGALTQGSHTIYFKATNDAGEVEGESGEWHWQFYKDTIAPAGPSGLSSPSHTVGTWSNNTTIAVTWTAASDDNSGIGGYSTLWDNSAGTDPPATANTSNVTLSTTSAALADGSYYFHIKAADRAGNWGPPVHIGPFYIETVGPSGSGNIHSTSHTVSIWSRNNTVTVTWTAASDNASGLAGYSVVWDTFSGTNPPAVINTSNSTTSNVSAALSDGNSNYFHIRAADRAGNWGSTVNAGPFYIDRTGPTGPTGVASCIPHCRDVV